VVGILFQGSYQHRHEGLDQNSCKLLQIMLLKVPLANNYKDVHVAKDVVLCPARKSKCLHSFAAVHTVQVVMMAISSIPVLLLPLLRPAQVMFTVSLSLTLLHAS